MDKQKTIKFRAWDKKNNIMIYESQFGSSEEENDGFTKLVEYGGEVYLVELYSNGNCKYEALNSELLMQYTGLEDKNGKEVFEGDILNISYSTNTVIPYYVKQALPFISLVNARGNEYDNGDYYSGSDVMFHNWNEFEIIGNIYENPNLLK